MFTFEVYWYSICHKIKWRIYFLIFQLTKSWWRSIKPPPLTFHKFKQGQFLWIGSLLDTYLQWNKSWRNGAEKKQLPLNCVRPHKEIVKNAITGWMKEVLRNHSHKKRKDYDKFRNLHNKSIQGTFYNISGFI